MEPDFSAVVKDYIETEWESLTSYATELAETVGQEIINPDHIKDALTENIAIEIYEAHRLNPAGNTPTEIWPETYYDPLEEAVSAQVETDLEYILVEVEQNLKDASDEAWERYCEYNEMTLPKN